MRRQTSPILLNARPIPAQKSTRHCRASSRRPASLAATVRHCLARALSYRLKHQRKRHPRSQREAEKDSEIRQCEAHRSSLRNANIYSASHELFKVSRHVFRSRRSKRARKGSFDGTTIWRGDEDIPETACVTGPAGHGVCILKCFHS